jgi:hypothetical protein
MTMSILPMWTAQITWAHISGFIKRTFVAPKFKKTKVKKKYPVGERVKRTYDASTLPDLPHRPMAQGIKCIKKVTRRKPVLNPFLEPDSPTSWRNRGCPQTNTASEVTDRDNSQSLSSHASLVEMFCIIYLQQKRSLAKWISQSYGAFTLFL